MPRARLLLYTAIFVLLMFGAASPAGAGQQPAATGTLERVTVHARALEGNLEGNSPDRPVVVYRPPNYAHDTSRRYPVLHFLHGYTATAEAYVKPTRVRERFEAHVLPFFSRHLGAP